MARHKLTKVYMFRFTVEGGGRFPTDMLRHDSCWPASEGEARRLADGPDDRERRTVTLKRASVNASGPTVDRWRSFGWTVTNVEPL